MGNYDIYKYARDMAWKFLIENNVTELLVNLSEICRNNGYHLLVDKDYIFLAENERGVTFFRNGEWYIVLNPSETLSARRYTIAHEIGHIYLRHIYNVKNNCCSLSHDVSEIDKEYQAERFAIDVLAPACVLWGLNLHKAEDISRVCNISMPSAEIRAERMDMLYKRNRFLTSDLERQVFEQFKPFMKS